LAAPVSRPQPDAPSARKVVRPTLRDSRFALLVFGEMINSIGSWAAAIALWGFATYHFHASAYSVSVLTLCWAAPAAVLGPFIGVHVDRLGPRPVLVAGYAAAAIAALGLAAATSLLWLDIAAVLYGVTRSITGPAAAALLPRVVDVDDLLTANALVGAAGPAGQVAGPVLASVTLALAGFRDVFVVDAATYMIGVIVVALLPLRQIASGTRLGWYRELAGGLSVATRSAPVRRLLLLVAAVTFTSGSYLVVEPLYARQILHRPPSQFALFEAAAGVGAFMASLVIPRARSWLMGSRVVAIAACAYGMAACLFIGTNVIAVAYSGAFLWGVASAGFGTVAITTLQKSTPLHTHGRVMAVSGALQSGVETLSLPAGGATLTWLGIQGGALALGGVTVAAGVASLIAITGRRSPARTGGRPAACR
jgi:MFS family permease